MKEFKVTIIGEGINITQNIDEVRLAKILPVIISSKASLIEDAFTAPATQIPTPQSVREFLNEKNPKTNPQKITTICMYLRDKLDHKNFSVDDVKQQLENAQEAVTQNFSRDFKVTLRTGWIAESHTENGKYFLTLSGEKAIQDGFSGRPRNIKTKSIKKSGPSSLLTVREGIENLVINSISEKYGGYWKLVKKADRVLWLLALAKDNGFSSLNHKEISLLAKKLSDDISSKNITAIIETHKKESRISPSIENSVKVLNILQPGIDYLENLKDSGGVA